MTRFIFVSMFCLLFVGCDSFSKKQDKHLLSSESLSGSEESVKTVDTIPLFARKIIDAYHDFDIRYLDNHLIFADGTSIIYDDGKEKSFVRRYV